MKTFLTAFFILILACVSRAQVEFIPENYFPNDDPSQPPIVTWKSHGNLLFNNWLNYYVYQLTPFDVNDIGTQVSELPIQL